MSVGSPVRYSSRPRLGAVSALVMIHRLLVRREGDGPTALYTQRDWGGVSGESMGKRAVAGNHVTERGLNGFAAARADSARTHEAEPIDVELFAGAGGLALGLSAAGLPPHYLLEIDKNCCDTLRRNAGGRWPLIKGEIIETDITSFQWKQISRPVRLLSGGPPCQPFSLGGRHLAERDTRNRFACAIAAVRHLRPSAVLFENVPGLARPAFLDYLNYLKLQLEAPSVELRDNEGWEDHNARLLKLKRGRGWKPEYNVQCWVLNAADFGSAQVRVRVYLVATKAGLQTPAPPVATHSRAKLEETQIGSSYWRERGIDKKARDEWPRRATSRWDQVANDAVPWCTVRDALSGLPSPPLKVTDHLNHWLIPGARLYKRHSGSELDWPSKAVKAGVHGVAGGENVVLLDDGSHRYFSLREMARLQGFPDAYEFMGPRSRIIGQIGNAVPCGVGKVLGKLILEALETPRTKSLPNIKAREVAADLGR